MCSLIYATDETSLLNKLKLYSCRTKTVITPRTILQLPSLSVRGVKDTTCCCVRAHEGLGAVPALRAPASKAPALCWQQTWPTQKEPESSEIYPLQWTNLISQEAEPWKKGKKWTALGRPVPDLSTTIFLGNPAGTQQQLWRLLKHKIYSLIFGHFQDCLHTDPTFLASVKAKKWSNK